MEKTKSVKLINFTILCTFLFRSKIYVKLFFPQNHNYLKEEF
jgi:hypothetical protein